MLQLFTAGQTTT